MNILWFLIKVIFWEEAITISSFSFFHDIGLSNLFCLYVNEGMQLIQILLHIKINRPALRQIVPASPDLRENSLGGS